MTEEGLERLPLDQYRNPQLILAEAREAAVALKGVIAQKSKPVIFQGEQYLEFEDWQTVGRFYRVSSKIIWTRFVEFGSVIGFEARAVVIDIFTGVEISAAEAMCLNDEENWGKRPKYEWHYVLKNGMTQAEDPGKEQIIWEKGKDEKSRPKKKRVQIGEEKVPLFQLRSMAQTRACAKALRNVLAWVVVLAGYKPTPAEEMPRDTENIEEEKDHWRENFETLIAREIETKDKGGALLTGILGNAGYETLEQIPTREIATKIYKDYLVKLKEVSHAST